MRASLLPALFLAVVAHAAPPKITGDHEVQAGGFAKLAVPAEPGVTVVWDDVVPAPIQLEEFGGFLVFTGEKGVTYTVKALLVDFDKKTVTKLRHVVKFAGKPQPPPPNPDDPDPPAPPPKDLPIKGDGLRMLVVWETAELSNYPSGQVQAMSSADVRDYLRRKCPKGPDGKTPEFRVFDKDLELADGTAWRAAHARAKAAGKFPRLLIANGKDGYEGDLPGSADELLKLLKKYGGE